MVHEQDRLRGEVNRVRRYSVLLLVLLGLIVVATGALSLLRETGVFVGGLGVFSALVVVVLGLWIMTCSVECRKRYDSNRKS